MKKICLSFVLSVVSVFSISAQNSNQSTGTSAASENVKAESANVRTEAVKQNDKPSETDIPAEKKPAATSDAVKDAPVNEPVKVEPVKAAVKTDEPVKNPDTTALPTKTELPAQIKTRTVEPASEQRLSAFSMNKPTLEGLSTGDAAIDGYIEEFSALYNVDPLLIYAQMSQESSFKAGATSGKGASGYMQLMPDTARRFGVTNVYNPKQNIKAGVKYMRWLLDKFGGDMSLALAGYNAGEGSVMKFGNKVPPYRETQNYVTKIMKHYDLLSTQGLTVARNDD